MFWKTDSPKIEFVNHWFYRGAVFFTYALKCFRLPLIIGKQKLFNYLTILGRSRSADSCNSIHLITLTNSTM